MKTKFFFLLTALLLSAKLMACGPFWWEPYEYYMFRVYDKTTEGTFKEQSVQDNCLAWQRITSSEISLEAIYKAVYKGEQTDFTKWLKKHDDKEVQEYLTIASDCEKLRSKKTSPWYYPSKDDATLKGLSEIVDKCSKYHGMRLKDRYALQTVRAMYTMGKFPEMKTYWKKNEGSLPEGTVKDMVKGYVAAAYLNTNEPKRALEYYFKVNDVESVLYCYKKLGRPVEREDQLALAARLCPDSPWTYRKLQEELTRRQEWEWAEDRTWQTRSSEKRMTDADASKYYNICMEAVKNSNKPAVWYYTAAFIKDLNGKGQEASNLLAKAEGCKDTPEFIQESVRVMRFYLDSKLCEYNDAYEAKLLGELRWLEDKMRSNLTAEVKEEAYNGWSMHVNFSFYYWNDMMRKVLLSEVAPRMADKGREVLSRRMLNYADNSILNVIGKHNNALDYSNFIFKSLDDGDMDGVLKYIDALDKPSTELEKFLDKGSYTDKDYLWEIVGTKYLRALDYPSALAALSKVSRSYQKKTNLGREKKYISRDPFSYAPKDLSRTPSRFKYGFAKKMCDLEKQIKNETNLNKKGLAMVNYGLGMRSSFDHCWALTQYHLYYGDPWLLSDESGVAIKIAAKYINEGVNIMTEADQTADLCVKMNLWETAAVRFPESKAGSAAQSQCDKLVDYEICYAEHSQHMYDY